MATYSEIREAYEKAKRSTREKIVTTLEEANCSLTAAELARYVGATTDEVSGFVCNARNPVYNVARKKGVALRSERRVTEKRYVNIDNPNDVITVKSRRVEYYVTPTIGRR